METKFPEITETIFTAISKLAAQHQSMNLGQGFPDYDGHPYLKQRLNYHVENNKNQYCPMIGVQELRYQVSLLHSPQIQLDSDQNITITSGATEALLSSILALIGAGDEVIVFDPAFDCYLPQISMAGATAVGVELNLKNFKIDWAKLESAINNRTKMIILNFPHNPCGSVLEREDLDRLYELIKDTDILLISDEVYQYMVFDDKTYISPFYDNRLSERTIKIASFGKMFHMTGWKMGYILANEKLSSEIRKVHQYNTFCSFAPAQYALADMLETYPNHVFELANFYQKKRDTFLGNIKNEKLKIVPSEGSYFQMIDFSQVTHLNDFDYSIQLIEKHQLAAIPMSALYKSMPSDSCLIRFSFAKKEETLLQASEILNNL